jgi:hypothetical protein
VIFGVRQVSQIRKGDHPLYSDLVHRLLICVLAIVAACYRPRVEGACEVQCDLATAPACPSGLACGADGLCHEGIECSLIDAGVDDVVPDEAMITPDCVQTLLLGNVCPTSFVQSITFPPTMTIQTDVVCGEILNTPAGEVCLFAAETIIVNAQIVRATGTRPLALFGRSSIVINTQGSFDVQAGGAGMSLTCNTPKGRSQAMFDQAAGGGAGGTMLARGGNGGVPTGFPGVFAPIPSPIAMLRGGCPGGAGGDNSNGVGGGIAGLGGGAIQLMSPGTVVISGTINAYGGGGRGGSAVNQAAGGGGGGSGGLIAIDANKIIVNASAVLRAHGGGGGGGAAGTGTGGMGGDALATDGSGAAGGMPMGGNNNGFGGGGSSDASPSGGNGGNTVDTGAGAGGGGGGAGVILLRAAQPLELDPGARLHPPGRATP